MPFKKAHSLRTASCFLRIPAYEGATNAYSFFHGKRLSQEGQTSEGCSSRLQHHTKEELASSFVQEQPQVLVCVPEYDKFVPESHNRAVISTAPPVPRTMKHKPNWSTNKFAPRLQFSRFICDASFSNPRGKFSPGRRDSHGKGGKWFLLTTNVRRKAELPFLLSPQRFWVPHPSGCGVQLEGWETTKARTEVRML
jgi:hypothetical protein